jgi:uncharacterized protein YkwD
MRTKPGVLLAVVGVLLVVLGVAVLVLPLSAGGGGQRPAVAEPPPTGVAVLGSSPSVSTPPSPSPSVSPSRSVPRKPSHPPSPTRKVTTPEDQVAVLVNQERAKAGCGALRTDERLRTAARGHSTDMAQNGYFSHTGRNGSSFVDRIAAAGYPRSAAGGENIAMGYRTPAEVMDGWMNSEGHRENILNCGFKAIGVGVARDSGGAPYWTQDFGRS